MCSSSKLHVGSDHTWTSPDTGRLGVLEGIRVCFSKESSTATASSGSRVGARIGVFTSLGHSGDVAIFQALETSDAELLEQVRCGFQFSLSFLNLCNV